MLIVTGSAGFIGSHIARNYDQRARILLIDDPRAFRENNYFGPRLPTEWDRVRAIQPDQRHKILDHHYFPKILEKLGPEYAELTKEILPRGERIEAVLHIGAITDTSKDRDPVEMHKWNTEYSQMLWKWCALHRVPFLYASSAATYGLGEQGFSDDHAIISKLKPLNPYAQSKQDFDAWVVRELESGAPTPPNWWGLKFFNVYGPCEGHKGRMASTILFSFRAIRERGACPLFRSHKPGIADGEQKRDFVFVDDLVKIVDFLLESKTASGIYNAGSGQARSFHDMARAVFTSLGVPEKIEWIDTPPAFRESYQYFTEARMEKLRAVGYKNKFVTLEAGVESYVRWLEKSLDSEALNFPGAN
jgi:ADP-L-glycero-D-manno-heptose 6-epimerase